MGQQGDNNGRVDEQELFRRAFEELDGREPTLKRKFDRLDGPVARLSESPTHDTPEEAQREPVQPQPDPSDEFARAMAELDAKPKQEALRKKFEARESKREVKARAQRTQQVKEEYADVLEKQRLDREQAVFRRHMEGLKVEDGVLKQKGDIAIPKAALKRPDYAKQVRRGKIEGEAIIDLHGMRTDEALEAVKGFIHDTRKEGMRIVKVITGKGLHSDSGDSVVRQAVLSYLHGRGRQYVREFHVPPPKDGGGGALYLFLEPQQEGSTTGG